MAVFQEHELLTMAVEITEKTLEGASVNGHTIVNLPDMTTDYIQAVYDKLKEINDSMS